MTYFFFNAARLVASSSAHILAASTVSDPIWINRKTDHAAVILKFEEHPNEVFFLEATSNNGVSLRRWSSIKPHLGTFYLRVVIRHIDWERTEESLSNLEVFMKEVVGNSYSFSMKQLFKRTSVVVPKKSLPKTETRPV